MNGDEKTFTVPLAWHSDNNIRTVYANQLLVSHASGKDFYLHFGELDPMLPKNIGSGLPSEVIVETVSRVAVTYEMAVEILRVLGENVRQFEIKRAASAQSI